MNSFYMWICSINRLRLESSPVRAEHDGCLQHRSSTVATINAQFTWCPRSRISLTDHGIL